MAMQRANSIKFNQIYKSNLEIFCDMKGHKYPTNITADAYRQDMVVMKK